MMIQIFLILVLLDAAMFGGPARTVRPSPDTRHPRTSVIDAMDAPGKCAAPCFFNRKTGQWKCPCP